MTQKSTVRFSLLGLATLVALVVCLGYGLWSLYVHSPAYRGSRYTRGHANTQVFNDLRHLALAISFSTGRTGTQPPAEMGELLRFSEVVRPGNVLFQEGGPRVDPNGSTFYDLWDNPVKLVVVSRHHYNFISSGRNGIDEAGKGDDILYEFDPWELVSSWAANEPNRSQEGVCSPLLRQKD